MTNYDAMGDYSAFTSHEFEQCVDRDCAIAEVVNDLPLCRHCHQAFAAEVHETEEQRKEIGGWQ